LKARFIAGLYRLRRFFLLAADRKHKFPPVTFAPSKIAAGSNALLGLIYPEVCQLCKTHRAPAAEGYVCPQCWTQVQFIRKPFCDRCGRPFEGDITTSFVCSNCHDVKLYFTSARSAVVAKTAVLEVIHRFKYNRALWFEPFLADLLLREALPALSGERPFDAVIPVPLHPLKLREREFNQAELLARHLAKALSIPLATKIVKRISPTLTQTKLSRDQRAANMAGAFAVAGKISPPGKKRFIVVDDVLTTGATTNACARALRKAGAGEVCVWTVARGL
jgi:ComF family protein